ncbi:oxygen-dependent tRNA uridine(34) hydroxylase TrhO [Luteibaculum oceani]|uniref:tRNA uridine(34) hydroxylase n=1 Tax=Luteibaculum oceani TaxID=1294296 RepID=A0A5C6V449_9FLAO|nr:rhodanese-related sulfurtransferase [Luteibaculum oceani]TXC78468.1 rhodanese-related sulfurtransferase [Luteibaculum oceani]
MRGRKNKEILYNLYDKETLRKELESRKEDRFTLSFYQYAKIENPELFRDYLFIKLSEVGVLGRIYVAHEGINAQISVPKENYQGFIDRIEEVDFLRNLRMNLAVEHDPYSFLKLKIKVRAKIVADGLDDETFDVTKKGIHVNAQKFNELTDDPNTIVVDMRNHYESEIGHFKNAITPDVDTFRDALNVVEKELEDQKDKNIVMYCTGGIRCEKASAYYKHKGFKNVYQLEGGIIEYARQVKNQNLENKFVGANFVFDDRLAEQISDEVISECHQCGKPWPKHSNCVNDACHLLFIQCDECKSKNNGCCSEECQEFIQLPAEEQKAFKSGKYFGMQVFKKGRQSNFIPAYQAWKKDKNG